MIASLLLLAAAQDQDRPDFFARIIVRPTGANGYEEYVRAVDYAVERRVRELILAVDADDAVGSRLDRQRAVAGNTAQIQTMVEQGNKKPVRYPRKLDFATLLPELAYFRTLGRALAHKADVNFADGQVNQGFKTVMTVIEFGDKLSGSGPVIHNLIGRAAASSGLRLFDQRTALISLPAAHDVQRRSQDLLEAGSPLERTLRMEFQGMANSIDMLFSNPEFVFGGQEGGMKSDIGRLSDEQLEANKRELMFAINRHFEARLRMFEMPEREWPVIAREIEGLAVPESPIAKGLFEAVMPTLGRIDMVEIGRRTQLRLLIAHAEVAKYRWSIGHLPGGLDQLPDQTLVTDPLTGELFEFERTVDGYTLYSRGTPDTGRIDLTYSPPRASQDLPD